MQQAKQMPHLKKFLLENNIFELDKSIEIFFLLVLLRNKVDKNNKYKVNKYLNI